jgi:Flp pilus assembly pilin Flp
MVEYLLLVGVVALLAVVAFRYFNTSVRSKVQQQGDTVVKIASECVGGLCPIKPEE